MATVNDILTLIQQLAPPHMAEDWDNVGLLLGRRHAPVTKILVALDPFYTVCREAADWGAELIVTHHPLIFHPTKALTDDTAVGESILFLAEHGIAAINAHTNLDCAPDGVNDTLARTLGLADIQVVSPSGTDDVGRPWGLIRSGTVAPQPLEAFLSTVKEKLGCKELRYVDGGKPVHKVAVGGGACAFEVEKAHAAGCDTFVTADVGYNRFWDARDLGLTLIDAGHFHTENPVCKVLTEKLRAAFPDVTVRLSEMHRDHMKFW